jgi:hypothetical protein
MHRPLERDECASLMGERAGRGWGVGGNHQMNTSYMHSSGALVLDLADVRLMDRAPSSQLVPEQPAGADAAGDSGGPTHNHNEDDDDDDDQGGAAGAAMPTDAAGAGAADGGNVSRWSLGSGIVADSDVGRLSIGLNEVPPAAKCKRHRHTPVVHCSLIFEGRCGTEPGRLCRPLGDAGSARARQRRGAPVPQGYVGARAPCSGPASDSNPCHDRHARHAVSHACPPDPRRARASHASHAVDPVPRRHGYAVLRRTMRAMLTLGEGGRAIIIPAAGRSSAKRAAPRATTKSTGYPGTKDARACTEAQGCFDRRGPMAHTELEAAYEREKERRHQATAALERRARLLSTSLARHGGSNPWDAAAGMGGLFLGGGSGGGMGGGDDDDSDDELGALAPDADGPGAGAMPAGDAAVPIDMDVGGSGSGGDDGAYDPWGAAPPLATAAMDAAASAEPAPADTTATHISSYEELCRLRIVRGSAPCCARPRVSANLVEWARTRTWRARTGMSSSWRRR